MRSERGARRELGKRDELLGVTQFSAILTPSELASRLTDPELRIVDCRASLNDVAAGRVAYREGHLPQATFADLLQDLSGPVVPGTTGRHPLPDVRVFALKLRSWGIGAKSQVVAYDDAGGAFAARLWWLLRWLGHEAVAVLDGGSPAWVAEGHALTAVLPSLAAGDFTPRQRLELQVSTGELERPESTPRKLFDGRAPERFRGDAEPIDPIAGHIPGAENLPFSENLSAGQFRSSTELRRRFADALGATLPEAAVMYCGSGVTACHNVLAFAHAGLPLPRLYAGSWSEWITDPARPTERHDGR